VAAKEEKVEQKDDTGDEIIENKEEDGNK